MNGATAATPRASSTGLQGKVFVCIVAGYAQKRSIYQRMHELGVRCATLGTLSATFLSCFNPQRTQKRSSFCFLMLCHNDLVVALTDTHIGMPTHAHGHASAFIRPEGSVEKTESHYIAYYTVLDESQEPTPVVSVQKVAQLPLPVRASTSDSQCLRRLIILDVANSWAKGLAEEGLIAKFMPVDFTDAAASYKSCLQSVQQLRQVE